ATPLTNAASVSGGGEVNTGNDSASDVTTMTSRADIGVAKIASSGSVTVGSNVDFTITATNAGPSNATGVQITDQLPAGLTFVSATPSAGIYNSGTGVWNIGAVASGASETLTITATVTTTGSITNTATKTAENETDPNAGNNSASAAVNGQAPDLTILKSHVGPFVRGTSGSYSLTVGNVGPVPSGGLVTVADTLPAGLTPSSASGSGWTCGVVAQVVTCTRSDALAAAGSYPAITITVAVLQSAPGSVTNSATVGGGGDLTPGNNSASDPTTVTSHADVGVTKTASSGTVVVGSPVSYTVTALNAGPSDATGVEVSDLLPAGLAFVSASPSVGTYDSTTGVWTIGSLPSGTSSTLVLIATVTGTGTITNSATKSAENEIDPNLSNNAFSASIVGQAAPGLPGPPNGGMAPAPFQPDPLRGSLMIEAGLAGFFGLLFLRRRVQRVDRRTGRARSSRPAERWHGARPVPARPTARQPDDRSGPGRILWPPLPPAPFPARRGGRRPDGVRHDHHHRCARRRARVSGASHQPGGCPPVGRRALRQADLDGEARARGSGHELPTGHRPDRALSHPHPRT
ncbi:MAG: DUF11 domain-containing protein, partial [Chloroflexi bacterium]